MSKTKARYSNLDEAVDMFALEMKAKLRRKTGEGYFGWDDVCRGRQFRKELLGHLLRGDSVDVANFAMFLWNIRAETFEPDA